MSGRDPGGIADRGERAGNTNGRGGGDLVGGSSSGGAGGGAAGTDVSDVDGSFQKAMLVVLNGRNKFQGEGGSNTDDPSSAQGVIEFAFNPTEITLEREPTYGEVETFGQEVKQMIFTGGGEQTLELNEVLFDTSASQADVREAYLNDLFELVEIDGEIHEPPKCQFIWGKGLNFVGHVEEIEAEYTRFTPSGVPVRATVEMEIQKHQSSKRTRSETHFASPDKTKTWTVGQEDTLWLIAESEYGDPNRWRTIADANGIEDPRSLEPGTRLQIPPLE